jgi:hypothetical protein
MMVLLELFIDLILPAALRPWDRLRLLTLEAPVVLRYLKAPTAVKLTAVWLIAF